MCWTYVIPHTPHNSDQVASHIRRWLTFGSILFTEIPRWTQLIITVLLLLNHLPHAATMTANHDHFIDNTNFGVHFSYIGEAVYNPNYWYHSYQFKLPTEDEIALVTPSLPHKCIPSKTLRCDLLKKYVNELNFIHNNTQTDYRNFLSEIYNAIPVLPGTPYMQRRSLLPFAGTIISKLVGLTTEHQYKKLLKGMKALSKQVAPINKHWLDMKSTFSPLFRR